MYLLSSRADGNFSTQSQSSGVKLASTSQRGMWTELVLQDVFTDKIEVLFPFWTNCCGVQYCHCKETVGPEVSRYKSCGFHLLVDRFPFPFPGT